MDELKQLIQAEPDRFAYYAEKILDSYFGNIFVTWKNEKIVYVNKKLADSIRMTKEELTGMPLETLRSKNFWLRSVSKEMYETKKAFSAYNISKWGEELFTQISPITDENGEVVMSAQFSIPKAMLSKFAQYVTQEKADLQNYKDIVDYLENQRIQKNSIICESPVAKLTFHNAELISGVDSTVLLYGESGVGKDVLAEYIYRHSSRNTQPFIPVNCAAIPPDLMESELFGYDRGAFTGARSAGKPGLFEMANHGTLFLDEIGELPLPMQSKLLRVLESGEVMRIGSGKLIKTDVRLIVATNRDLKKLVEENKFREDLFYRLNVIPMYLSPLRDRKEDIIPLAQHFLERNMRKYKLRRELTPDLQKTLLQYNWPGNIRELRNVIERFSVSGHLDIAPPRGKEESGKQELLSMQDSSGQNIPLKEATRQFEQRYIRAVLDKNGGSIGKTADALGIHRSLLYKKLHDPRSIT